jgi:DNA invertase Pin-like site-specific DNA recombinase
MSEAELHILKARMHEGRKAKTRRGELVLGLPRGYVLKPSGEVALDPAEGVQRVVTWAGRDSRSSICSSDLR